MGALVVIPARYGSTRFPGKPLAPLKGKPLIQHVYENSRGSRLAKEVLVATDSREIMRAVLSFGGRAVMTSRRHRSGTDRAAEVARRPDCNDYDIIVNVQGDEPLVKAGMIDAVISLLHDKRASIGTLAKKIEAPREILDPNVVKVAFDREGFALYFSRAPIPFHRAAWRVLRAGEVRGGSLYKHVGIYSYRKNALLRLASLKPTALEKLEMLEQLRALEAGSGMRIKVARTNFETIGVDTPADLKRVGKWLSSSS